MAGAFLRYDDFRPVIKELPRSTTLPRASRFDTTLETPSGALAAFVPPQSSFTNTQGVAAYRPDTRGRAREGWMRGSVDHTGLTYIADEASRVGPAGYSVDKADSAIHPKASRPVIGHSGRFGDDTTCVPGPGSYADQPPISKTIKPLAPAWSFGKPHGRTDTQSSQVLLALKQSIRQSMTGIPPSNSANAQSTSDTTVQPGANNQQQYSQSTLTYRGGRSEATRPSTAISRSSSRLPSALSSTTRPHTAGADGTWSRAPRDRYNAYYGKKFTAWQDKTASTRSPAPDAYEVHNFDISKKQSIRVYTSEGKWRP